MELFATCGTGLEAILGQELRGLGMDEVRPLTGGVAFSADLEQAYTALLWSRVASRILLVLERVEATDSDSLYAGVRGIAWEDVVAPGATIAVNARGTNDQLRDTRYTALRVKDAVCDRLRDERGERPDVDAQHPDLLIQVNLHARRATVYIDLSGTSLENRGYRDAARSNSPLIHETLAAAMLLAADWPARARRGEILVDSMCAAGTLVIEAALIAGDVAPGITRSTWGFSGWCGHDEGLWETILDAADARAQAGTREVVIYATEAREREMACARARAKAAAIVPLIEFLPSRDALANAIMRRADARGLFASCLFVSTECLEATLPARYAQLAGELLDAKPLEAAVMLVEGQDADAYLGRERTRGYSCMNGSAPCDIALFDLRGDASRAAQVSVRDRQLAVYDASAQQFADRLNKVFKQRRKWASKNGISAYRIYDADLPDYNMAIDLYEGAGKDVGRRLVHVAEYAPPKSIDATKAARRMTDALNIASVVLDVSADDIFVKRRVRAKGGSQYAKGTGTRGQVVCPTNPSGTNDLSPCPSLITQENGLLFEVDLASYLDTGLFLDHRDTRELVGKLAAGKSFLNLFAYTCTASVYAAAHGAKFTTSVDLSNTYLQWGERNMELNGLMNGHQEFVRADCVEWVQQTRHTKMRWDLIFVDPPTFSNSAKMRTRGWDVQRDHAELLIGVSRLLSRGGAAVFSCNLRGFKLDRGTIERAGVQVVDITDKTIPLDFERHAQVHHCFVLRRI
ncbi:MAG TPA: bifunctional 23S rRNA (guanine(2069)-N(7))-methyltransferase RlmK/23S rRNA (guanine(2445)-N(2))-methyltransferase RlmL [Coriobacteriaceae bacterium]|nr:bifunctional 23S rRNA (guanine(2069)-N(7))-methyltransferase RlmK/23S rRNA (guanine(2445)-N(2))-methyltransferase RlmL [Coriobacteriaceae bacterium]